MIHSYRLGDVCSRLSSGKNIKAAEIKDVGLYPVYGGNGCRGYADSYNFDGECAIIGRQGAYCGNVQLFKGKGYMTEHAVIVVANDKANSTYLGYVLSGMNLGRLSHQAAQPGISVKVLSEQMVDLPDVQVQNRIVDIISKFDNLIENSQKQIKLLEEAAQRLYKEWFVDLRFLGYESVKIVDGIPIGWKKDRADSFFDITIGKTPPRAEKQWFVKRNEGIPWLSISDMGNAGVFVFETNEALTAEAVKKHNMKVVPEGTIFVSFKLTVGRVAIATSDMCTNEAIAHFYINDDVLQAYTYSYLKNFEYDTLGNTSSISKAVNSKIIKAMPFVMPTKDIVEKYSSLVLPIINEIRIKQDMCNKLAESRDRLLPKLMNGEKEV